MRIIVFTTNGFRHPAIKRNIDDLIEGFKQLGHDVVEAYIEALDSKVVDMLRKNEADLTVGINNLWVKAIQSKQRIPHVTVLLDEPFNATAVS